MSSCVALHTQLASIMEVLANAAVAEICKLIDDGYAVLRSEMSRSQKENEVLKRKLSMKIMELRIAKQGHFPSAERAFHSQLDISLWRDGEPTAVEEDTPVQSTKKDESADLVEVRPQSILIKKETLEDDLEKGDLLGGLKSRQEITERAFEIQMGVSLWRDGEPAAVEEEDTTMPSSMRDECVVMEEGRSQSLLIKEETLEEDLENSDPQGGLRIREETVESDGESVPIVDTQTAPATDIEELTEQHRTRHSVWEDSGLDAVLKAEPEIETVNLEHTGPEHSAGRLNVLSYEDVIHERPSQQMPFTTQGITEKDTDEPACSYPVESDSENLSVHSELLSGKSLSSLGSLDVKREDETIDSELLKVEAEMRSAWSKEIMSGVIPLQHSYYGKDWDSEELLLESDASVCPEMAVRDSIVDIRSNASGMNGWAPYDKSSTTSRISEIDCTDDASVERFICTCCGKSFNCQNVFEAHQRTHAAEKPFNCPQCGKRFAQLSNLITHRRVHTGEKPYSCTHCGKQFAQSRYLVTHLRIHTGEKPFSCTQCGKRFAQSNNLVRHQSVHTGKKPFRCSQCGKSFTTSSHRKRHESVHSGGRPYPCTL